jgi:multimeric flavodoxin WrbA
MNVTIINGSPRTNGSTHKVLTYFYDLLRNDIACGNIYFIDLINLNISYCIGCQSCHRTGRCIILEDPVEEVHDIIKNSDGLIFGSPTYYGNVTGIFKNFQERVHMILEQLLYQKPCINVVTYENMKGNQALKIMKDTVVMAGGYTVAQMLIKNETYYSDPLNERTKGRLERAVKLFIKELQKKDPPLLSRIYTKFAVKFLLKNYIYKDKDHNLGIIKSWAEKNLIEPS